MPRSTNKYLVHCCIKSAVTSHLQATVWSCESQANDDKQQYPVCTVQQRLFTLTSTSYPALINNHALSACNKNSSKFITYNLKYADVALVIEKKHLSKKNTGLLHLLSYWAYNSQPRCGSACTCGLYTQPNTNDLNGGSTL